jgi:hypothetical protein
MRELNDLDFVFRKHQFEMVSAKPGREAEE